jgi:hypothetical protein
MKKYVAAIIIFLLLSTSCTYEKVEPRSVCETPVVVSFKNDIQPIFDVHCNTAGCHSGTNPEGNLNLEASQSYAQLWRKKSGYLDTLNPKYSVLYASMNSISNPMPPTGKLDACTLDLILKWIEQKAKNN